MDTYSILVSKVLDNKILSSGIEDMETDDCLNLVSTDWKVLLDNNPKYQNFSSKKCWTTPYKTSDYDYNKCCNFEVILVAECKFAKPYNGKKVDSKQLVISDSIPLMEIAKTMTSDLGPNIKLDNEFKFSFSECGTLACANCRECSEIFQNAGYKMTSYNQPCIIDTKVFDGKKVVNRFLCHIENLFNQTFRAILKLNINIRYSFKNSEKQKYYRISGNILNIIVFNESKLNGISKKIDVGNLVNINDDIRGEQKCDPIEEIENLVVNKNEDNEEQKNNIMEEFENLINNENTSKRKTCEMYDESNKKIKFLEEDVCFEEMDELLIE